MRYVKGEEPKDAVTDPASVKGLFLHAAMAEDQPLKTKFLGKGAPAVLPEGHVAFSIWDLDNIAEFVEVGSSRVDVIWTVTKDGKTESRVFAENLLVLAISSSGRDTPKVVTVVIKREEAEKLVAAKTGRLSVVLRKPDGKCIWRRPRLGIAAACAKAPGRSPSVVPRRRDKQPR